MDLFSSSDAPAITDGILLLDRPMNFVIKRLEANYLSALMSHIAILNQLLSLVGIYPLHTVCGNGISQMRHKS